jgi:ferric-dicitrate binding protein FerR (iron transport regulator)
MSNDPSMHFESLADDVFDRYLAGRSTPAECQAIERLVALRGRDMPSLETWAASVRSVPVREEGSISAQRVAALVEEKTTRRDTRPTGRFTNASAGRASPWTLRGEPFLRQPLLLGKRSLLFGVTAAIFAVVIGGVWHRFSTDTSTLAGPISFHTSTGERRVITFSDGSTVTLAPKSRVTLMHSEEDASRVLDLRGRASFSIIGARAKPFIVRTGHVTTRVLGTVFDVKSYPDDPAVTVAVASGRVMVSNARGDGRSVAAGKLLRATDSTMTSVDGVDVSSYTAWIGGHLKFREASVVEVVATLERWYDVRILVPDSMTARRRLTATLDYGNTEDLVRALEILLNVTATRQTSAARTVITLHPNRRMPRINAGPALQHPHSLTSTEVGR